LKKENKIQGFPKQSWKLIWEK